MLCQLKSISKCGTCMSIRSPKRVWPSHFERRSQGERNDYSRSDEEKVESNKEQMQIPWDEAIYEGSTTRLAGTWLY